jgi:hypothetical protein
MSNNNANLETKILNELIKTGFPTEVVCAGILQKKGWRVTHNPSYIDDIEGISREYDIRSYKNWSFHNPEGTEKYLDVFLLIECKKSDKPWVFFTTEATHDGVNLGKYLHTPNNWLFTNYNSTNGRISDSLLLKNHHYFQKSNLARTFYEPFKGHESADVNVQTIYSAVMSSIKATLFHVKAENWSNGARIYYPVIIFNGNLFEAVVKSYEDIEIHQTPFTQLSFNYIIPQNVDDEAVTSNQKTFIVDIVHETYFSDYLKIIEDEHLYFSQILTQYFIE